MMELRLDENLTAALTQLMAATEDCRPAMESIAEYLVESTRRRFDKGESPEGVRWAAKSPVTLARSIASGNGADTRPLHQSLTMVSTLFHSAGSDYVEVSSGVLQAAVMQFGAKKGQFGAYSGINKKGHPYSGVAPWGDIPARPYLGLSQEDQGNIVTLLADYLTAAVPDGP